MYTTSNPYLDANFAQLETQITALSPPNNPALALGYWSPLTNGNPASPDLIYTASGDTVDVWVLL